MAKYYWLTVTYCDGRKVRTPHKGEHIHFAIQRSMKAIGATLELGDALSPEEEAEFRGLEMAAIRGGTLGWYPAMDVPEDDGG